MKTTLIEKFLSMTKIKTKNWNQESSLRHYLKFVILRISFTDTYEY